MVSHLTGETGLRILRAILAGERDPVQLVTLRDPQITKSTVEEMRQALVGDWRPELLFVLKQSLQACEFPQEQMNGCDVEIEKQLRSMRSAQASANSPKPKADPLAAACPKPKRPQSRKRNDPQRDLAPELARVCGVDLMQAHGLRILTILGGSLGNWR